MVDTLCWQVAILWIDPRIIALGIPEGTEVKSYSLK